jgi:hypothetical protein
MLCLKSGAKSASSPSTSGLTALSLLGAECQTCPARLGLGQKAAHLGVAEVQQHHQHRRGGFRGPGLVVARPLADHALTGAARAAGGPAATRAATSPCAATRCRARAASGSGSGARARAAPWSRTGVVVSRAASAEQRQRCDQQAESSPFHASHLPCYAALVKELPRAAGLTVTRRKTIHRRR